MPSTDSPAILVARFLQANNYHDTLTAFLAEAGLPPDAGSATPGALTLERVLEEKKLFDLSLAFEKIGVEGANDGAWTVPAPSIARTVTSLPTPAANVLHVSVKRFENAGFDANSDGDRRYMFVTTADKRVSILSATSPPRLLRTRVDLHDSPVLSLAGLFHRWLLTASMSGQLVLSDTRTGTVQERRKDHEKFVVHVVVSEDGMGAWIATAGWDNKVLVYRVSVGTQPGEEEEEEEEDPRIQLGSPVASITLPTNPQALLFVQDSRSKRPVLLLSRRDSTRISYYALPPTPTPTPTSEPSTSLPPPLPHLGTQDLAPHSNAWLAFSPSSMALCPIDPTLIAVATSSVPHMKLLIVRLRIPTTGTSEDSSPPAPHATQESQTRHALRRADDEDAAVRSHTNTMAPQSAYSTPCVCWRPDGSGVWVNGDDGVARGVEAKTGRVVEVLKGGHEAGVKIRTVWGGDLGGRECLITGGFDKKMVVWEVGEGETEA
ncbi:MAG: hypothetical protein M1817_005929 [Caeruleum heppii]|nr:MAG: hypothetical protein M1817_005929 [Caeruleum heppii]